LLPQPVKTHFPSVFQLLISLFGLVMSILTGLFIFIMLKVSSSIETLPDTSFQQLRQYAWLILLIALLSLPSLVLSIRRLARLPQEHIDRSSLLAASIAFLVLISLLVITYVYPELLKTTFVQVFFTCLAVAVPLWWFLELGRYKLRKGSNQRFWGLVNFQIFAGMPLIIFFEVLVIAAVVVIGGVWLFNQADFKPFLMTLQTQLLLNPQDMEKLTEQITQIFQKPGAMVAGLMVIVVLIPLVEEILKPLALWFFIKKQWTPAEGFTAGLACGASFALVESLTAVLSVPQGDWLPTLIARVGTGLLHVLTTGLNGWALVSAWRDKKFNRLGLTYLISVSLHGTWNLFAILYGVNNVEFSLFSSDAGIVKASPWVLGILVIGMLTTLVLMNQKIRRTQIPPAIPPLPVETIG